MLKRIASLTIIVCLMLHCAARLGALSYLYENRDAILFHCGLINERPVPLCSSSYEYHKRLTIATADEGSRHAPTIAPVQEIDLFILAADPIKTPQPSIMSGQVSTSYTEPFHLAPAFSIFHPPLI